LGKRLESVTAPATVSVDEFGDTTGSCFREGAISKMKR